VTRVHNFYCSPSILEVAKQTKLRQRNMWRGETRNRYEILVKKCNRTTEIRCEIIELNWSSLGWGRTSRFYLFGDGRSDFCNAREFLGQGFIFIFFGWGLKLSSFVTSAIIWPIVPTPDDDGCGAVGGMISGRGNRRIRRKPAPVPLCPPQIPRDLTWDRTGAASISFQRNILYNLVM
jgi:hypothetical protein